MKWDDASLATHAKRKENHMYRVMAEHFGAEYARCWGYVNRKAAAIAQADALLAQGWGFRRVAVETAKGTLVYERTQTEAEWDANHKESIANA